MMHPEHVRLVRESWTRAAPQAEAIATTFYTCLFTRRPAASARFAHVDMAAQRRKLLDTLDLMVRVLDDPFRWTSEVVPSGRRHAGYGVDAADYAAAGAALLDALAEHLGHDFTPATRDAWRALYTLLAAVMQRAGSPASAAQTTA